MAQVLMPWMWVGVFVFSCCAWSAAMAVEIYKLSNSTPQRTQRTRRYGNIAFAVFAPFAVRKPYLHKPSCLHSPAARFCIIHPAPHQRTHHPGSGRAFTDGGSRSRDSCCPGPEGGYGKLGCPFWFRLLLPSCTGACVRVLMRWMLGWGSCIWLLCVECRHGS
jgi:hypothetical protein